MQQLPIEKADRLTSVEVNEPASLPIADLNLTDAEADEIKGGPMCHGTTVLAWARVDGVSASNHNETVSYDEADLDQLNDLQVDDQQAEAVCGGDGTAPPRSTGGYLGNHNETVAEDESAETVLADLPVKAAEQVKGGNDSLRVAGHDSARSTVGQGLSRTGTGTIVLTGSNTY